MDRRRFLAANAALAGLTATRAPWLPTRVRTDPRTTPAARRQVASSRDRLEAALARIADPSGEGARACLTVYEAAARAAADAADARARAGVRLGPLDGAIVTLKDLFDVAGEPTRAGSVALADAPPAAADAPIVRRLRAAGAVIVAKTNMVEFAFSGVGVNPHYGTPGNPADRSRVPGGSSSGAPVVVADGMCEIAIGTDTGGSTRIPAALCGVVGYKPTQARVPTAGAFPLSYTLDSVGPIAGTVADCAATDAVLAGEEPWTLEPAALENLRLGIPQGAPLADLDRTVSAAFDAATSALGAAGVRFSDERTPLIEDAARVQGAYGTGGSAVRGTRVSFASVEAWQIHRELLAREGDAYDPRVRVRVELGREMGAADYIDMVRERAELVARLDAGIAGLDALVLPTCPIVAPTLDEVAEDTAFFARNSQLLRNTAVANFYGLCAISLPLPRNGGLPVGLMLMARAGEDRRLFRIAAAVERHLGE